MVDNLGSVQSSACARSTLSEKIPLTGPLSPVCAALHQQPTTHFLPLGRDSRRASSFSATAVSSARRRSST
eukprot:5826544-Prymnesium_polylepis.1